MMYSMCKEKGITTGICIMCRLVPGTGAEWKERAALYLFECFQVLFIYNEWKERAAIICLAVFRSVKWW